MEIAETDREPEPDANTKYFEKIMAKLSKLSAKNSKLFYSWRNELFTSVDYTDREQVDSWFEGLRSLHEPHYVGSQACVQHFQNLMKFAPMVNPVTGVVYNTWNPMECCNRYWVIDALCSCFFWSCCCSINFAVCGLLWCLSLSLCLFA